MALSRGTQLGSCEILELIGAGGMGEVYRGRDTRLGRDVAVKTLPAAFAADTERLARFQREAQVLAALNHPNLAIIHELKELNGARYLILELVEGETLAERIARGPIAVDEALGIAKQIAEALESAHEKGIVHRDLKPANVKITPEGRVKVLDFGLAKIYESVSATQNLSNSPTVSRAQTAQGMILGTAAYMSPEQARGKDVDRRADVWAFGCVLYEMLTGRQTFPNGETVSDTLAGILAREPAWQPLPAGTPPKIRALLERCLRKDERRRWSGMANVRLEIEEARGEREASAIRAISPSASRGRERVLAGLALLFLLMTAGVAFRLLFASAPEASALRSEFYVPPGTILGTLGQAEISPDGRTLAFVSTSAGKRLISVRPLDSSAAQPIPSSEGTGAEIFWSADSQYIAFSAEGKLKKVAAGGGPSQGVSALPAGGSISGTWNAEDVILLGSGSQSGPLMRVSGSGGEPAPETELDASRKEISHLYPSFLPDGKHFLYLAQSSDPQNRYAAYVGELGSKERHPLPGIASRVRYSASSHILFIRDGALMAQPFDVGRFETTGGAFPVADPFVAPNTLTGPYSVSMSGDLAYSRPVSLSSLLLPTAQFAWFDRVGKQVAAAGPEGPYSSFWAVAFLGGLADLRGGGGPELSPDGNSVAFSRDTPSDIWVLDLEKGLTSRLTSNAAADSYPVWSPVGRRVAFRSERDGPGNLYEREVDAASEEKPLLKDEASKFPTDWSKDYLVYHTSDGDIWALPLSDSGKPGESGDRKPVRVTNTPFFESDAKISPDGKWIAYVSNEPGHAEVYIQSFPQPGFKQPVSKDGGVLPRWSPDGKELFYNTIPVMMAVSIRPLGTSLQISAPVTVFPHRIPTSAAVRAGRFLALIPSTGSTGAQPVLTPDHIVFIQDWARAAQGKTR